MPRRASPCVLQFEYVGQLVSCFRSAVAAFEQQHQQGIQTCTQRDGGASMPLQQRDSSGERAPVARGDAPIEPFVCQDDYPAFEQAYQQQDA
jgi:hypothetical protein